MNLYVGTSGYSYSAWKGRFYPSRLPSNRMLAYYAERLNAVEINSTFYRLPALAAVHSWAGQVGPDFRFALKAPRRITHERRLRGEEGDLGRFFELASALNRRAGPILFQLPPTFKRDVSCLQAFLARLPAGASVALEFRDASWFDDTVFTALQTHDCALCITDTDTGATPWTVTASFGYLRLRKSQYTDAELVDWLTRMRMAPWSQAYVFFKHEDEAKGPALAARLTAIAAS
jgi:uncharacterized protein YecE (DUF72 family)